MEIKKYIAFSWNADDEGGYWMCPNGEFNPNMGYDPNSGWRAQPSVAIGEFSTVEELAHLLFNDCPDFFDNMDNAMEYAEWVYTSYINDKEDM